MKQFISLMVASFLGFHTVGAEQQVIFFESFDAPASLKKGWRFDPSVVSFVPDGDKDGGGCVRVTATERGANAISRTFTGLQPQTLYRISASLRCDSVAEGRGAVLYLEPSVSRDQPWNASQFCYGTDGWKRVYMDFVSDPKGCATVCCGVGFPWPTSNGGTARGTVYIDDVDLCRTSDSAIYYSEGEHIVLCLDADKVTVSDEQAQSWISLLDATYEAYAELLGETPYQGRKIRVLSTPGIEPGYWALAGNPILWNNNCGIDAQLRKYADTGDGCFGILHEIGHTFSAGTIGHPDNWNWTDEVFANFRMSYALERNNTTVYMRDLPYTGAEIEKYYKLTYDETIGAGQPSATGDALHYTFLRIKDRFGWMLFQVAFRRLYAMSDSDMEHLDTPLQKFRFFIDCLSDVAGEDLYQTMYTPQERELIEQGFAGDRL